MISRLTEFFPAAPYFAPLLRSERKLLARFTATTLGRSVFSILSIFLVQNLFAELLGEESTSAKWMIGTFGKLGSLALVVAVLFAVDGAAVWCRYDNQIVLNRLIKVFELGMMERLIRQLLKFSALYFQRLTPGDMIQTLRQDIFYLRVSLYGIATIVLNGATAGALVAAAVWLSPQLSFWVFCVLPLGAVPVIYTARRMQQRSILLRKTGVGFFDFVLELISGVRIIKAYMAEERATQITLGKANRHFDELTAQVRLIALGHGMMEMLAGITVVLVLMAGSVQILQGTLVWSELFAFLLAIRGIVNPVNSMYKSFLEIQGGTASVLRITELLNTQADLQSAPDAIPLKAPPRTIAFEGVAFGYGDGDVLSDATFEISAGESVAIVGPSGAGKSTLLNLFTRFMDPTKGKVLYDGRDIREIQLPDIYGLVAIVSQEPFLFATTVRENIRAGKPQATDQEVEAAAIAAFVHDDILDLPEGYNTALGIGGRTLSRGQSQRINLARAFLKNAPILLLDEATSSLDAVAEEQVQRAINHLMEGRTSLFVTHKLAALDHADRVILVDGSGCAMIGTHQELYRESAVYRQMCEIQQFAGAGYN
jgi:subfamily B ATP-binding cassette protein MsbA